jgi:hypothetical protein
MSPARKVEKTPLMDTPRAKRHHTSPLGENGGVKGCNRLAGARSATYTRKLPFVIQ